MSDIEDEPPVMEVEYRRVGHARVVDDAHVPAGKAVGQDVARPQQGHDLVDRGRSVADVDHQRQTDAIGQLARQLQGTDADAARGVLVDARLDAQDQVAIGVDDRLRQIDVAVVEIGELPGRRDQPIEERLSSAKMRARLGSAMKRRNPGQE